MSMTVNHQCDRCGGPRSEKSKGLCISCYRAGTHPDCMHHWLIGPPRGPTSHGRCKACGDLQKFNNSFFDPRFNGAKKED